MLRFALPGVLLLSIMAASQTAMQAGIAPLGSTPYPSPILSCFGQNSANTILADSILRLSPDVCARENDLPTEINPTAACVAVTRNLPEAPSASPEGANSADPTPNVSETSLVSPALASERDTYRSGRTLDRKFILLHALSTVALVADLETTVRSFEGQAKATEVNPLFGAHPTRARLYGIAVPLNALSFYLSYHYKKVEPGRSIWKVGPGLTIAVHTAAVINNLIATHR